MNEIKRTASLRASVPHFIILVRPNKSRSVIKLRASRARFPLPFSPSFSFIHLLRRVPFSRLFLPGATTCNPPGDRRFKVHAFFFYLPSTTSRLELALAAFFALHLIDWIANRTRRSIKRRRSHAVVFLFPRSLLTIDSTVVQFIDLLLDRFP